MHIFSKGKQNLHNILTICILYIKLLLTKGHLSFNSGQIAAISATVISGQIAALSATVTSERFAALNATVNRKGRLARPFHILNTGDKYMGIQIYEVDEDYIDYLCGFAEHLFHNKQAHQKNTRKYIGILFSIGDLNYFAPLSSFKDKHKSMKDRLDFIKVGDYCVINLNNMFPVIEEYCTLVDIANESDLKYRKLLLTEARLIKKIEQRIVRNANQLYEVYYHEDCDVSLKKRCNDFKLLEEKAKEYQPQ